MALVHELVLNAIFLVTRTLLLAKVSCLVGIRSMCIIILTWIELFRAAICIQLRVLWAVIIWIIAILSLPVRALSALQREKMLEMRVLEMHTEVENMIWNRKKLEERLQIAVKERGLLEELLVELDDENDEAFCKIKLLEEEVCGFKAEILELKSVQCERFACTKCEHGCNVKGQDMKNVKKEASKSKHSIPLLAGNVVEETRDIALSGSFFSMMLSVSVGIIVWEARDPCMPLVAALICAVIISLASVVRFFSTIHIKSAIDAVALLSLNCFILGILTYPALPGLAEALVPFIYHATEEVVKWGYGLLDWTVGSGGSLTF